MDLFGTSVWQALAALVVCMVIGAAWYSPALFGNAWMKALGKKKSDLGQGGPAYLAAVAGQLTIIVGLAYFMEAMHVTGADVGASLGVLAWLFFAASTALINRAFQGGSFKLYAIDMGYLLAVFVVAGAILGL